MEIVKNPAYLRFVKYEHWLAFAGIVLVILPILFFLGLQLADYDNYISSIIPILICTILTFTFSVIPFNALSLEYYGIKHQWEIWMFPFIFFLVLLPLLIVFKGFLFPSFVMIFTILIIQESFWRGIFIENLLRQGFTQLLALIISTVASTTSYFFQYYILSNHRLFLIHILGIFTVTFFSSFFRLRFSLLIALSWFILSFYLYLFLKIYRF